MTRITTISAKSVARTILLFRGRTTREISRSSSRRLSSKSGESGKSRNDSVPDRLEPGCNGPSMTAVRKDVVLLTSSHVRESDLSISSRYQNSSRSACSCAAGLLDLSTTYCLSEILGIGWERMDSGSERRGIGMMILRIDCQAFETIDLTTHVLFCGAGRDKTTSRKLLI